MRLRPFVLLATVLCVTGYAVPSHAQEPQPPASSPPKAPQETVNKQDASQTPDGKQAEEPPKPPKKLPKVITNDDLAGLGRIPGLGQSEVDMSGINDCDRTCFDSVHNTTGMQVAQSVDWKRDLLRGIEKVSADGTWQAALLQLARVKAKFCDLNQEKNDTLAANADPKNVTERELEIDEEYDRKFKNAQQELNAALGDADAVMRNYSGVIVAFMRIQKDRASNRPCVLWRPRMSQPYRPAPDDPDDP